MAATEILLVPAAVNITLKRGDERDLFQCTVRVNGAAEDVSGDEFVGQVRDGSDGALVTAIDVSFVTDGTDGKIRGRLPDGSSASMRGNYRFDVEWRRSNGDKITLLGETEDEDGNFEGGRFRVLRDVSRS